ncbi:hypothetical protein HK101_000540 [Irineochytrium annulatum]|nr:hypothetical protein HK101_000540 [Irineochytrium annulatum]
MRSIYQRLIRSRTTVFALLGLLTLPPLIFFFYTTSSSSTPTASSHRLSTLLSSADENQQHYASARAVVSISTFPGRVERINDTIRSLKEQRRVPDAVYLHIPKEIKRLNVGGELPPVVEGLREMYGREWLLVTRPEDYGPSTKLLGSLLVEKDPKTIIITLDDDMSYDPSLILSLVDAAEHHPTNVICFICEYWPWWWWKPIYQRSEGECHGWANAYAGTAYRVGMFKEDVFEYEGKPKGCKLHDDVYLSGYLFKNAGGVRPYVINPGFFPIISHKDHTNLSINKVPNGEKGYRDPCIKYYDYFE